MLETDEPDAAEPDATAEPLTIAGGSVSVTPFETITLGDWDALAEGAGAMGACVGPGIVKLRETLGPRTAWPVRMSEGSPLDLALHGVAPEAQQRADASSPSTHR